MLTPAERAARRYSLGSSEIARIVLGPQFADDGGAFEIYHDKIGSPVPERESDEITFGTLLEPSLAAMWTYKRKAELSKPLPVRGLGEYAWMGCSCDRLSDDGRIVELKYGRWSDQWGPDGCAEGVPLHYLIQVQWQLATMERAGQEITGAELAALVGGDFRIYLIPRSEALINELIRLGRDFWDRVEQRRPPEPCWEAPRTGQILEALYPWKSGEGTVDLPQEAGEWHEDYQESLQGAKHLEECKTAARNRILAALAGAKQGRLPDGRTIVRSGNRLTMKA